MSVLEDDVNLMSLLQDRKFWVNKCMCVWCLSGIFAFTSEAPNAILVFFGNDRIQRKQTMQHALGFCGIHDV